MMIFQTIVLCIVIIYYLYWFSREHDRGSFFLKLTVISIASWIVEDTSIRIYHFYQYSPDWRFFIGQVPVIVVLVWPIVIHSGWELAYQLMNKNRHRAHLAAALIIWIDASLIETIAVKSGYWSWNAAGIWEVPLIGIFGWAFFAFLSINIIMPGKISKTDIIKNLFSIIVIVCGTHVMIVATWWLIFRWILFPVNMVSITVIAWFVSGLVIYFIHREKLGFNMDSKVLIIRVPPAVLFLIVYLNESPDIFHTAYILAFSFSYIFLIYKILTRGHAAT